MIRHLIKNNMKLMFRNPANLFLFIAGPLLVLSVLASAFSSLLESYKKQEPFVAGYRLAEASFYAAGMETLKTVAKEADVTFEEYPEGEPKELMDSHDLKVFVDFGEETCVVWKREDAKVEGQTVEYLFEVRSDAQTAPVDGERLTGLKWLRLNDNRLSALPDLSPLVSLRRIYLRNNRFESVPESLKGLPSLTDVDLSGNPLSEIPEWLARKEGLRNLSFSRTRVTRLPGDLSAWRSLRSLQLGDLDIPAGEMKRIRDSLPDVAIVF